MKLKASLFSKIFSHRPGKAKSVEFTLTQSRFNTIQKYAVHFEESFRNPTLVRTRHHIEKYSRKMCQSLACQETLRYQHLKKKNHSGILTCWYKFSLLFSLVMEELALFCHSVLPPVSLCLDFTCWLITFNENPFSTGDYLGCFELKINWE